ncbi:MAG: HIT family protein [Patescibacteria group bacterium]|jgi:histidine triad (HIT) family protein
MEDCIFCKIAKGKVPSYKIYEDEHYLAFLDIFPYVEGHTLVIPKKHYRWVWDLPEDAHTSPNIGEYMSVCKKVANHYKSLSGIDLVISIVLGEQVPHAHIHLLPNLNEGEVSELFGVIEQCRKPRLEEDKAERLVSKLKLS